MALHIDQLRKAPLLRSVPDIAELLVNEGNSGNELVKRLLNELVDDGPSAALNEWLDGLVSGVLMPMTFVFEESRWHLGHVEVKPTHNATTQDEKDAEILAIGLIRILIDEYEDHLHRCGLDDCKRFFVGDTRSKWCSKTCGSKARARRKREKDRKR